MLGGCICFFLLNSLIASKQLSKCSILSLSFFRMTVIITYIPNVPLTVFFNISITFISFPNFQILLYYLGYSKYYHITLFLQLIRILVVFHHLK